MVERRVLHHFRTWEMCKGMESTAHGEDVTLQRRNPSSEAGVREEEDRVGFCVTKERTSEGPP